MAARGITVLLASGDNGVGCDKAGTTQEYDYPSSPYITMGTFLICGLHGLCIYVRHLLANWHPLLTNSLLTKFLYLL